MLSFKEGRPTTKAPAVGEGVESGAPRGAGARRTRTRRGRDGEREDAERGTFILIKCYKVSGPGSNPSGLAEKGLV